MVECNLKFSKFANFSGTKSVVLKTSEEDEDEDDADEEDDPSNVNTKFAFTLLAILSLFTIYEPPKE